MENERKNTGCFWRAWWSGEASIDSLRCSEPAKETFTDRSRAQRLVFYFLGLES